jgi:hypothetical protein
MKATLTIEDQPSRSKRKSNVTVTLAFEPAVEAKTSSLAVRLSLEAMASILKDPDILKAKSVVNRKNP